MSDAEFAAEERSKSLVHADNGSAAMGNHGRRLVQQSQQLVGYGERNHGMRFPALLDLYPPAITPRLLAWT